MSKLPESAKSGHQDAGKFPFLPLNPLQPRANGDSDAGGLKAKSYLFTTGVGLRFGYASAPTNAGTRNLNQT